MASLKSKLRKGLMSSHNVRKNTRNSLWLVYSPKSHRDISLASNNECIYWVAFLETDPGIQSFEFGSLVEIKFEDDLGFNAKEVIKVTRCTGESEFHFLASGTGGVNRSKVLLRGVHVDDVLADYVVVHFDQIQKKAVVAGRWLNILAFAALLIDEGYDMERDVLELLIKTKGCGTVGFLLSRTETHDPMKILGVFSLMAMAGTIEINLVESAFGRNTVWTSK